MSLCVCISGQKEEILRVRRGRQDGRLGNVHIIRLQSQHPLPTLSPQSLYCLSAKFWSVSTPLPFCVWTSYLDGPLFRHRRRFGVLCCGFLPKRFSHFTFRVEYRSSFRVPYITYTPIQTPAIMETTRKQFISTFHFYLLSCKVVKDMH